MDVPSVAEQQRPSSTVDDVSLEAGVDSILDECARLATESERFGDGCDRGSARMYKASGKVFFVSQAESYAHRGPNFAAFSPVEFECIVDIRPRMASPDGPAVDTPRAGRPRRQGFDLGANHPLFCDFQGFVFVKFRTPMFGGAPPPTYRAALKNESTMRALATYLLATFTPWSTESSKPQFELSGKGLASFMKQFDNSAASMVWKQRCWMVRNILKTGYRSSSNERIDLAWRNRNADFWKDIHGPQRADVRTATDSQHDGPPIERDVDMEPAGRLAVDGSELMHLLRTVAAENRKLSASNESLKELFWSVVSCVGGSGDNESLSGGSSEPTSSDSWQYVYSHERLNQCLSESPHQTTYRECSFSQVAKSLRTLDAMLSPEGCSPELLARATEQCSVGERLERSDCRCKSCKPIHLAHVRHARAVQRHEPRDRKSRHGRPTKTDTHNDAWRWRNRENIRASANRSRDECSRVQRGKSLPHRGRSEPAPPWLNLPLCISSVRRNEA